MSNHGGGSSLYHFNEEAARNVWTEEEAATCAHDTVAGEKGGDIHL